MQIFFNLKQKIEKSIKKFLLKKISFNEKMLELTHEENIIVLENKDKEEIGYFKMGQLPGCCGVVCLYNVNVHLAFRQQGIGKEIFQYAKKLAKYNKYSILLCTTSSKISEKIVFEADWKPIDIFVNNKTGNTVKIHTFHIKHDNPIRRSI